MADVEQSLTENMAEANESRPEFGKSQETESRKQ